jgi:peptidoglycan hydrolase-like protein with peptidoglycan-binding domain
VVGPYRDLTEGDLWQRSLDRSRERRAAAAERGVELPGRELSVAALLALAGGPVAGVAVGKALEDEGGGGARAGSGERPAAVAQRDDRPAAVAVPEARRTNRPLSVQEAEPPAEPVRVASTTSTAEASPPARKRGGGVVDLQRALGVAVDGDFGRATEKALERWQREHGLEADGVVGPETRAALHLGEGEILKRERPRRARRHRGGRPQARLASRRRRGGGVRGLQRALGLSTDGVFGPATEVALKRWQRSHGLEPDGVAGPHTRAKLGLGRGPVLKRRGSHRRRSGGGGGGSSVVQRVVAAANRIATKPYRYGGGHGSFTDSGYDCSGSVSYALHGGGLLSRPLDSGGFMSYGRPGRGRRISIYASPGHVYMTIDGRRFDTSARYENGSRWSGRGRAGGGYVVRHPPGL